jgi:hypothetical protein
MFVLIPSKKTDGIRHRPPHQRLISPSQSAAAIKYLAKRIDDSLPWNWKRERQQAAAA